METKYSALSTGEEGTPRPVNVPSTLNRILSFGSTIVFTAILSSTITTAVLSTSAFRSHSHETSVKSHGVDTDCGNSIPEAISKGCSFDMMAGKWQPPECHDSELLSEVLSTGPWNWYLDMNRTMQVPNEEVAKGLYHDHPLYVDENFHIDHCMYMWMKQHRAFLRGSPMEEENWTFEHTLHCATLSRGNVNREFAQQWAGFAVCRSPDMWQDYEMKEASKTVD